MFPITLSIVDLAFSTANDLAQITITDDRPLIITGLVIAQSSDLGDNAEEVLRWNLLKGVTTGATGGTSLTVTKMQANGPTPGASGTSNWTTPSTGGTVVDRGGFNIRVGEQKWYPPDMRPIFGQAESPISFRLVAAPTDAVTMTVIVYALEV